MSSNSSVPSSERMALTIEERQQALDALIEAADSNGVTPLRSVASSALTYLESKGFTKRRAGYILRVLTDGGGPLATIEGSTQRRVLRKTLLPDVTFTPSAQPVPRVGPPTPGDIPRKPVMAAEDQTLLVKVAKLEREARLKDEELSGVLEENGRLTRELETAESKIRELKSQAETKASAVSEALELVDAHRALKTENGTLKYDNKKLSKDLQSSRAEVKESREKSDEAARQAGGLRQQLTTLTRESGQVKADFGDLKVEHSSCPAPEFVDHVRRVITDLQVVITPQSVVSAAS